MKPYAENIQTFAAMYAGYAAAMDRFHEASKKHDATATFFPLFEALNWAVALDERAAKHWTPAGEPLSWEWGARRYKTPRSCEASASSATASITIGPTP